MKVKNSEFEALRVVFPLTRISRETTSNCNLTNYGTILMKFSMKYDIKFTGPAYSATLAKSTLNANFSIFYGIKQLNTATSVACSLAGAVKSLQVLKQQNTRSKIRCKATPSSQLHHRNLPGLPPRDFHAKK